MRGIILHFSRGRYGSEADVAEEDRRRPVMEAWGRRVYQAAREFFRSQRVAGR